MLIRWRAFRLRWWLWWRHGLNPTPLELWTRARVMWPHLTDAQLQAILRRVIQTWQRPRAP